MKKLLIVLASILGVIILILLLLPVFLKSNIKNILKQQSAKYINADLNIDNVSLSMFRDFPDLNVSIKDITITGKEDFAGDTLINLSLFSASVNVMSLIKGNEIIINHIILSDGKFQPTVSANNKNNWDILINKDTASLPDSTPAEESSNKNIIFKEISFQNLTLNYNDYKNSIYASVADLNLSLSGNFAETNTIVNLALALNNIGFRQGNNVWVNNTNVTWDTEIGANLKEQDYDIKKSDLKINDLQLDLTGKTSIREDKYLLDVKLNAPDTRFESLLALVPKTFQKHIEDLKTTGDFTLEMTAKGEYYTNHLPRLDINFIINNAKVQYAKLSESINDINLALHVTNPGGPADSTLIDLNRMSFTIANNPFNLYLQIANLNDPTLKGGAKGVINFTNLKQALPLKDITLQGVITTDITFNGKYQYIEKEQYEKFTAKGNILLNEILIKNKDFPQGISIPQGSIVVTPAYLNLNNLQAKINSSDFTLKGNVANYLPYIFKNDILKGNFTLTSNYINLNEFLQTSSQTDTTSKAAAALGVLEVPKNINLQLNTNIKEILFDKLTISNTRGEIRMANSIASLNGLNMDMLDGHVAISGKYNTSNPKVPEFDLNLNVADINIHSVYNSFTFIKKSIPIAMNCEGQISAALKFASTLDKNMNLVMTTADGEGYIASKGVIINDNPTMQQLATLLKHDELSRLSISSLKINFKMQNGNITIEPFKTTFAGMPATIYGNQTVDGKIDYTLSLNVARKYFGKDINNVLKALPGSDDIESLDVDVKMGGTLDKPQVKPDLSKALKTIKKVAVKELKSKALEGLKKLFK